MDGQGVGQFEDRVPFLTELLTFVKVKNVGLGGKLYALDEISSEFTSIAQGDADLAIGDVISLRMYPAPGSAPGVERVDDFVACDYLFASGRAWKI